ncbi:MAG: 3-dehydroquinate synthase [Deltaproteobacteria bacterium]|nr:3-dehydroquinate synthase [Deltaproteobacteria bacterium]
MSVELGERRYDVHVGPQALDEAEKMVAERDAVVITDLNVARICPKAFPQKRRVIVEAGESAKTLATYASIVDQILAQGAERRTVIVGLGGGVVGDLAGFVAATLFRGVPFVLVPTTLLAQVDAAIGGKNGVNWGSGKNLVGTFYQPRAVFVDVSLLGSLSPRDFAGGLAEVVKTAAIRDAALFTMLETNIERLLARDQGLLAEVVFRVAQGKADVVSADEREVGLRRVLNFGHTVGHAIEQATAYSTFSHGEAVSMGMRAALVVGTQLGITSQAAADRVERLCRALGLPTDFESVSSVAVGAALGLDKKTVSGEIQFVLIREIGDVVVRPIDRPTLTKLLWRKMP